MICGERRGLAEWTFDVEWEDLTPRGGMVDRMLADVLREQGAR